MNQCWGIMRGPVAALLEPDIAVFDDPQQERVHLRDGSVVSIRPVRNGDEAALGLFLADLCPETRRLRFFSVTIDTARAAHWAADTTTGHYGLLAHDETGRVLGHALYIQMTATRAEVAVEVDDHFHGHGLGTILIERLAIEAERRGITHFVAEVLCENRAMVDVFREGFDARVVSRDGPEEMVEFLTSSWRLAHQRFCSDA